MIDSQTLGRITRLGFALRRRLLEICQVPREAMTSDQRFREEFVRRAVAAGNVPQEDIDNIRRGVFGNLALLNVALYEKSIIQEDYNTYLSIHRSCRCTQCAREETVDRLIPDTQILKKWEKILH